MKKISIIHPHVAIRGGAIKTLLYFGNFLVNNGFKVEFLTFEKDENNCFPDLSKNITIYSTKSKGIGRLFGILKIAWKSRKSDIVIIGNSPMHFIAPFIKILNTKVKIIWIIQNIPVYYIGTSTKFKARIEKSILPFIDELVTNSFFIQEKVKTFLGRDSNIIYPSIDTVFFDNITYGNKLNNIENETILFTYSRLVKGKNIELAIKTFKELKNKFSGLKLIIGGSGEEEIYLKNLAKNEENIVFLGNLTPEEVKNNLEKTTIFLFTSLIDAFGLTITEALSMKKPVVAMNYGGVSEIIKDGKNGFLTDNENVFIKKVEELILDNNLRSGMGEEGRKCVVENFSLLSMQTKLLQILKK